MNTDATKGRAATMLLEDGSVFKGQAFGKGKTAVGEICFNTGMTGYQEIFTDPSYFGQIVVLTNDHLGNYGQSDLENESNGVKVAGIVCRNFSSVDSRKLNDGNLDEYLVDSDVGGLSGVDTRAIVSHIRNKGAMNAVISTDDKSIEELKEILDSVPPMKGMELASKVSTDQAYELANDNEGFRIAVLDFGVKRSILNCMIDRNARLKVFPAKTKYKEVRNWKPDGVFLSNGPGDPAAMDYAVEFTKEALNENIPLFGICLGQQILAQAAGIGTYKMHHGHRGINHPVKNLLTGRSEITSQNHGFEVKRAEIEASTEVEISHVNLNDGTIEGICLKSKPAFSVQYHPEASPGPHDSRYLFDQFFTLIKENKLKWE